jgi:hypothetical protein
MANFDRLVQQAIPKFVKGATDLAARSYPLFGMLKSKGRVKGGFAGTEIQWRVTYKRGKAFFQGVEAAAPEAVRVTRQLTAKLDVTRMTVAEAISKYEELANSGQKEKLIDVVEDVTKGAMRDINDRLAAALHGDSQSSDDPNTIVGLGDISRNNGTLNIASGAQRSANAADLFGSPTGTYAGLNCVLGTYGAGEWLAQTTRETVWPFGQGEPQYEFWSQPILNYNSTALGSPTGWRNIGDEAIRMLRDAVTQVTPSEGGEADLLLLPVMMYSDLKSKLATKERILIEAAPTLRSLGFKDSVMIDGCEITKELNMPRGVGRLLNVSNMTLHHMTSDLFTADKEKRDLIHKLLVWGFVQVQFNSPRYFGTLAALTS